MTVQDKINKKEAQIAKLRESNAKKVELNNKLEVKASKITERFKQGKITAEDSKKKLDEIEDIRTTREFDIKWNEKQIASIQKEIDELQPALRAEQNKNSEIEDIMKVFGVFADDLEKTWNDWDLEMKAKIIKVFKEEYENWSNIELKLDEIKWNEGIEALNQYKKDNNIGWDYYARKGQMEEKVENRTCVGWKRLYDLSKEQIKKENHKHVIALIYDLIKRVEKITGKITDYVGLHVGAKSLEGFLVGEKGKAEIWSILAGGYNIQRLHVRVLVKKR